MIIPWMTVAVFGNHRLAFLEPKHDLRTVLYIKMHWDIFTSTCCFIARVFSGTHVQSSALLTLAQRPVALR